MVTRKQDTQAAGRPEGKEGARSHQEGKYSIQAGHSQRRGHSEPDKDKPDSAHDHQKTVSGKKQHGPEDQIGYDAGGNEGSKGQNIDSRRSTGTGTARGDVGDNRGRSRTKE